MDDLRPETRFDQTYFFMSKYKNEQWSWRRAAVV